MHTDVQLKLELRERAITAGFMEVGVAAANLPPEYGKRLQQWVAHGHSGEMAYMSRTEAARAQGAEAVLPGARTVLVFAAPYHPGYSALPPASPYAVRIASYALGYDYHYVLREKLIPIQDWLSSQRPGNQWRICVDSAPLNERAYAVESGIGFYGRNTMVIAPGGGSFFLLAEIVTTASIQPDLAVAGTCGTCTRCIDACPTNAILAPHRLDANRCISYLTIEKKSELTEEEHRAAGEWVFGCDICQDVCPYNKHPAPVVMPEFREGTVLHRRETAETFLQLRSNSQFEQRFARSPLLRPGPRRLRERVRRIPAFQQTPPKEKAREPEGTLARTEKSESSTPQ